MSMSPRMDSVHPPFGRKPQLWVASVKSVAIKGNISGAEELPLRQVFCRVTNSSVGKARRTELVHLPTGTLTVKLT